MGSCRVFSCHYTKTDVQHRQPSTCSPPEECEAEPVGPANFPETGQIRRHITCRCCLDLLSPGKHCQTSIGLWTLDRFNAHGNGIVWADPVL